MNMLGPADFRANLISVCLAIMHFHELLTCEQSNEVIIIEYRSFLVFRSFIF